MPSSLRLFVVSLVKPFSKRFHNNKAGKNSTSCLRLQNTARTPKETARQSVQSTPESGIAFSPRISRSHFVIQGQILSNFSALTEGHRKWTITSESTAATGSTEHVCLSTLPLHPVFLPIRAQKVPPPRQTSRSTSLDTSSTTRYPLQITPQTSHPLPTLSPLTLQPPRHL